jgi:rSAM/selenodomain-associated transferase 2
MAARLKLSVIIPVAPGEQAWRALLDDLAALDRCAEVLLVAPSGQAPRDFAAETHGIQAAARWLEAPAGRARQQNAGAAAAGGAVLWFLHADSRVSPAAVEAAQGFAASPAALGYFDLRFHDGPALARLNAAGAWIRSRWLDLPFGDQGFILPRELFASLGGFDESLAAGEDHALVWAARRARVPLLPLREPVLTSARRYAEQGWLRTTVRHGWLTIVQVRAFAGATRRGREGTRR